MRLPFDFCGGTALFYRRESIVVPSLWHFDAFCRLECFCCEHFCRVEHFVVPMLFIHPNIFVVPSKARDPSVNLRARLNAQGEIERSGRQSTVIPRRSRGNGCFDKAQHDKGRSGRRISAFRVTNENNPGRHVCATNVFCYSEAQPRNLFNNLHQINYIALQRGGAKSCIFRALRRIYHETNIRTDFYYVGI